MHGASGGSIVKGERYSSYRIVIPRNYFEAITVSYKFLLNGIITISILIAAYRRMSVYIEQYELSIKSAECYVASMLVVRPYFLKGRYIAFSISSLPTALKASYTAISGIILENACRTKNAGIY